MPEPFDTTPNPEPPGPVPPALAACTDYEILRELGRGGMGVVYLARHRLTDRLEALKVMTSPDREELFLREVQAAARLAHPNIVAVHSARVVNGAPVLAMEYVDGRNLARLVTDRGPLPVAYACELIRQAAVGLQHAHEAGLVHRDVKPGNLMLSRTGGRAVVKVVDFGLARRGGVRGVGEPIGTPAFAAPEQVEDPDRADVRSDMYALGGTLYFILTGDSPFVAENVIELMRKHREEQPPRLDAARPEVPPELATLVARMMAKDPTARPQSAAEVARALARFAESGPPAGRWVDEILVGIDTWGGHPGGVSTHGTTAPMAPRRVPTRRVWWAVAVAAVALAVVGGFWAARAPMPQALPVYPTTPATPPITVGPVALFDGKSLNGWVVDGENLEEWRVEQGAIVTTGTPTGQRTWLLTERDYGDCRIRFMYRLEPGGNSGLALRAVPGERPILGNDGRPTLGPYHLQVELADDTSPRWWRYQTGQVYGGATSDGPMLKRKRPAQLRPAGEWDEMVVEIRGQRIQVTVNGVEILADDLGRLSAMGSRYPALGRTRGRIGFQQQVKTAEFRDITVEEFASPDAR